MKMIEELLYELNNLNVKLWVEGEQLRYKAPKGALTPSKRAELVERKAEMITFIKQAQDKLEPMFLAIQPISRTENLPLSFAQQRLWFLDQLEDSGSATYNMASVLRLLGPLHITALEKSLLEIVQRHETLRTTFQMLNGTPVQVLHSFSAESLRLSVVDLQFMSSEKQTIEVQRLVNEDAQRPFNLTKGPLLRTTLWQLGPQEHVIGVTMHHIISDGWSLGLFIREFTTLYEAFSKSQVSPLAPLSIQYADFAYWQRQWLSGEVLQKQLNYWQQQLANVPALLELPTDYPRSPIQRFQGSIQPFEINKALSNKLNKLSQTNNATLFMVLLAAFVTLLGRYSGNDDLVVGSPIAGRNNRQTESLIGFFVNTLVLRLNCSGNPSFLDLLAHVRQVCLDAYAHQDVPFEQLVEVLQPERNLSHTPLFQVVFVLQNTPTEKLALANLSISPFPREHVTAKFDLTLSMTETAQGLRGSFEYNTDLFERATIERMVGHFQTLLVGIVENPQQPIHELPLLTKPEYQQLRAWNNTAVAYPQDHCIHQLFEAQVEKSPDAIAVVFENQQLTYGELNTKANQLAHYLQTLGVKAEVLVGICVERSLEMVIGLLGILKAGGAYVPLDPSYTQDRLAFMLEDAFVSVLLTVDKLVAELPQSIRPRIVCLDTEWRVISQVCSDNPVSEIKPENVAYVIYTSGSTGKPKGVLVLHSNVTRLFAATEAWFHFNEQDVWTLFHSYAFDFSVWELWGALLYGGRLLVVPYWMSRSPDAFYDLLGTQHVTVLNQTPSAFRQLIQAEERVEIKKDLNLRLVIFGGEALECKSLKPWFERHGDNKPQLINMYGITETTVHVTYRPLTLADLNSHGSVIGLPIPDLQVYLLDPYFQLQPIGVPGELYIGGAGLARGYLNRSDLTQERFIPNPFGDEPSSRLYKTGDLARYLPDGHIEYLGRIDNQVKIRGFRIELGEIEAILMQHAAVRETIVTVHEDSDNHKYLVAYVVQNQESEINTNELRHFLKDKLPDYMVPATFVMLDTLPLTAHGKIDYRALPSPDSARPELAAAFVAPRTLEEELLTDIWATVLNLEQVGIYDNFFELGGDSIRSIQILAKAKEMGLNFSLAQFFQHQTIYELTRSIRQAEDSSLATPTTTAFSLISRDERLKLPDDIEDAYPLAALQAGMLFHSEYSSDSSMYHNVSSVHLRFPFDESKFRISIQELVSRHPVLRTSFQLNNYSEPLQFVHKTIPIPLKVENLCDLSTKEQDKILDAWFETEKKHNFDWSFPPLLRFHIHQRCQETFQLTWTEHHAIVDGWSVASLITELFQHYLSQLGREIAIQPPPSITFRDFIALERLTLESDAARQYWLETLNDFTKLELPRWPNSYWTPQMGQTGVLEVPLSTEISNGLKQLARTANVPIKSVLLAAHLKVLSVLGNQTDILTGLVGNGRLEETDGERVLGLFLNTLPFRLNLQGGTWIELVQQTFKAERAALPYRRFPLAEIQRMLGGQALFETAFNFTHFHVYQGVLGLKEIEPLGKQTFERTNFTLLTNFSLDLISKQVNLTLAYDAGELSEEQVIAISGYYTEALTAMASEQSAPYEHHSLLSLSEQQKLLSEWNNTRADYPQNQCIHQLFEAQVECTPAAIAVEFEGQHLSYVELNQKANQLAHYLQTLWVKPEVLVGIYIERSIEMLIGLLGILKAGGAYVPLDPSYPQERLAFMLEDSQVLLLLTQEKLKANLPEPKAQILCLDTDWEIISKASQENPNNDVGPKNLAYVIYTSGSTGKPKGVQIDHQSIINFLSAMRHTPGLTHQDILLAVTTISFDIAVLELYLPLMVGAKIVLVSREIASDGAQLLNRLMNESITVMQATPATWRMLLTAKWAGSPFLKILVGGEALASELAHQLNDRGAEVWNLYGPTETTVWSTRYPVAASSALTFDSVESIGRPIANTQIYILDHHLQPLPIGVSGELHIGGAGLARGYLNRPDLTTAKFIKNPFSDEPESRLYKTGDLARYLPDGKIEYMGRLDNQVKLRGFRIELGEIEAVLNQHALVQEAVVTSSEEQPGDQRLIAYIVSDLNTELQILDDAIRNSNVEQLSQWEHVWDENYNQSTTVQELTFNLAGWRSSYTGLAIPEAEMHEWVDATVNLILSLQPNRVLEIGCGTGLLLSRIAPHCTQYWGTDFSPAVLQQVEQLKQTVDNLAHIAVFNRKADDFNHIEPDSFDTIILNSVIQYFPNVTYLLDVLDKAINAVKPGGTIFVGDVRSLPLLKAYHASVQFHQAPDSFTRLKLQQRVQQRLMQEEELIIDPTFFMAIKQHNPRVTHLKIQPKQGHYHNELTRFRYDVILQVGNEEAETIEMPCLEWIEWQTQKLTLSTLRQQLIETQPQCLGLRGVPNVRLENETKILEWLDNAVATETVSQLRKVLSKRQSIGIEPEKLWQIRDDLPYDVEISWANTSTDGCYDVLFKSRAGLDKGQGFLERSPWSDPLSPTKPWHHYANNPLHQKLNRQLVPQLRQFLQEQLPAYMVPSAFVMLEAIPLTPNGKVDRRALSEFSVKSLKLSTDTFVAPQTPEEKLLANIWSNVLGIERVGIHDNFFELGGHSLLATQLMSRICETFLVNLPLHHLFQSPTVAGIAKMIDMSRQAEMVDTKTIIDLTAEAVLDITIQPPKISVEVFTKPSSIFLTGATGFLGTYLLYELLMQTRANVYCLVRSSSVAEGKKRLKRTLESYSLWNETFHSRIIPIIGDLSEPLLGIPEPQFRHLADQIDMIYHNGAWVNHIYPYSVLKAANVIGTQEVLRLASRIKPKPVHFISTAGVLFSKANVDTDTQVKIARESDFLDASQVIESGYVQSKWVAENLVREAGVRGLPVCIYRATRIGGDSQTGISNPNDFLNLAIKGYIQLGKVPPILDDKKENIIPVDYASRAIIHISQQTDLGKTFHLVNPHPILLSYLVHWIRSLGYSLEETAYEQWRTELNHHQENVLYPLLSLFPQNSDNRLSQTKVPQFECQNTLEGLADTDIVCPVVDTDLFGIYFSYFWSSGFLARPQ
ncbi:MAG: amino acid adenylation domain-containing protein [Candidatus Parabeggiatoa sp.]|nr:amino acid adenylation domain-containing protein [Candidatus Parabeggiatoa sp.]